MQELRTTSALASAEGAGESFVQTPAFEWISRAGFVARALVYGIIGILALKVALGEGGKLTNQQGALHTVVNQPFGKVLLTLVAIGLGGYSLWRLTRAVIGHGPESSDTAFERIAAAGSGVAYGFMCAVAVGILLGSGGGHSTKKSTGGVLGWPGGTWLVGLAGALFIGIALYQAYRGISQKFLDDSKTEEMSPGVKRWIGRIGTFGHVARAVVFGLVGIFLIKAAIDYNPNKAVGIDGALAKLANHSYGPFLLGVVAAGLIAFALYSLSDARYRRI
jgi:hypothetical protein